MITRETDYAIRMVLALCRSYGGDAWVPVSDIAEDMGIPYHFLRALSRKLVLADIVEGRRGNGGGLKLKLSPEKLSLLDVIQAIDARGTTLNTCLIEPGACARSGHCPVHNVLSSVQDRLEDSLRDVRFDQFQLKDANPA